MNSLSGITAIAILFCAPLGFAQAVSDKFCDDLNVKSEQIAAHIPAHQSGYNVVGHGRAYIYSAPLESCKQTLVFLVVNDVVNAYLTYEAFTSVIYTHPVSGKITEGWIKTERLAATGKGIGPNPDTEDR